MTRPVARRLIPAAAVTLVLAAITAFAQSLPKTKPGVWEVSTDAGMGGGVPPEMLAKMPPQMQAQMKQQMAQAAAPQRVCIGEGDQDIARSVSQRMGMDMKCTQSAIRTSGNTSSWSSVCSGTGPGGAALKLESENTLVYGGDSYELTTRSKTQGMGPADGMRTTRMRGRYIGPDCKALGVPTLEEQMRAIEAPGRRPPVR